MSMDPGIKKVKGRPKIEGKYCELLKKQYGPDSYEYKTYCKYKALLFASDIKAARIKPYKGKNLSRNRISL